MNIDKSLSSITQPFQSTLTLRHGLRHLAWLLLPAVLLEACWLALWRIPTIATSAWAFQGLFALSFAAYIWALFQMPVLARLTERLQIVVVLGGTLVFHLTLLPAPFALSDDLFRYVWNGRISAAGVDPYRFAPGDPALGALRDERIWPHVNAKEQPSPYPPLLEAWFALTYRLWPESLLAVKLSMTAVNLVASGLLVLLLQRRGQPPIRALVYAWSPQVVLQVAFSGHNEPLLITTLLAGLLIGQRRTTGDTQHKLTGRRMVGAWAFALATLAKLAPVFALPLLLRRWGWRAAVVYGATLTAVYGALLLRGQRVFDGALVEAGTAQFNDGLHYLAFWLVRLVAPEAVGIVSQFLIGIGMSVVVLLLFLKRSDDMTQPIGVVLAAYVLLAASVAPWYLLWVLPFVALNVLPGLPGDRRDDQLRLIGGFWITFSWTVIFSELFYSSSVALWRVVHVAEYALPVAVLGAMWWYGRRKR